MATFGPFELKEEWSHTELMSWAVKLHVPIDFSPIENKMVQGESGFIMGQFWPRSTDIGTGDVTITPPAGGNYRHIQSSAATTWNVAHNLGFYPNVTAVNAAKVEIVPGSETHIDTNNLVLTFSAAVSGEAYCS